MVSRSYSDATLKILFATSGNCCAHPDCHNPIVAAATEYSDEAVLGQICHIYAVSDDGPRGKPGLTAQERNSPQNLILMCGFHHTLVDQQYATYPATMLLEWKRAQEATAHSGTAEALRQQEKAQQFAYTTALTDQQIEAEVLRIRLARNLSGYPAIEKAKALAANVERIEFAGGSKLVRAKALAFCARLLAQGENLERAKALLEQARELGDTAELVFANAFIAAADAAASAPGLALLAPLNTPAARSAMLRMVTNERGPEGALAWAQSAGLLLSSFDGEGKLTFIMSEELTERWDDAHAHVQLLDAEDFQQAPLLNYACANALLAHALPEPLRTQVIFRAAFHWTRLPLGDDDDALRDRRRAIEFFERQAQFAEQCGVQDAAKLALESALLLRLHDAELHDTAMEELLQHLRDENQSLRYVPLAVLFDIRVDGNAIERRVNERIAFTGKGSVDEAVARLALALMKPTPTEAVEYLASHRDQIAEFIDSAAILSIEIELLCKSRQVESAKTALAQSQVAEIDQVHRERLERMIAEAEGADPAAERRKLYEKSGELVDLVNLVTFLEEQSSWQEVSPLAATLFDKTHATDDAIRVARAYRNAGKHKNLLDFLLENVTLVGRSDELRSVLAWTLYHDGQFKAANEALASVRARRDHVNDRALFVNLAIATGQWDSLVGFTTTEWQERDDRTAEDLLRAGQLAQVVGGPHARELIVAATERAPADPRILAGAYFLASGAGWENEPGASEWLMTAAEKSGDDGPLKSINMKELFSLKPDWDRRNKELFSALGEGRITVSAAAYGLNQSMIHFGLLLPSANRAEPDARRRSIVYAFSGARPASVDIDPRRIALDLTAIFTLAQSDLLDRVVAHHDRAFIPDQLLVWLFSERQRVSFHQPSRLKEAHFLKRLLASGALAIFSAPGQPAAPDLMREVGYDLAAMLHAAEQSTTPAFVIRSAPVSRIGSLMDEQADLTAYGARLCSCQAVVEALRHKGMITAAEEGRALSYLKLHELRWPGEPRIADGAFLYLDDLSTTYLRTVGVLDKLKAAGFVGFVTKSLDDQDNQLLAYESMAEQQLSTIEAIRGVLAKGLADGSIETIASPEDGDEDMPLKAQLNFMATEKPVDAFVVDDRFVNRFLTMTRGDQQTPILTSLDLVGRIAASGAISAEEEQEHRTNLRRSGYSFVPTTSAELVQLLMSAPLVDGALIETAELRAIRESVLGMRLGKLLQIPHELPWLEQLTRALLHAARGVWKSSKDAQEAEARCEWLIPLLDTRGWASIAEEGTAAPFSRITYASLLHGLTFTADSTPEDEVAPYHRWIEKRFLHQIADTEPEIYRTLVDIVLDVFERNIDKTMELAEDGE